MMKGDLIKYPVPFAGTDFIGIIIDVMEGYHLRKTWSEKRKFIKSPMVKIYWFSEPNPKPATAKKEIAANWNISPQLTFGFAENMNNYIIDEWDAFLGEPEWYSVEHFVVIGDSQ